MNELLAAADAAAAAFAKMLVVVDRTGWRGNSPADAAKSDEIVGKIHRGRGAEKYTGRDLRSSFGLQGISSKLRLDLLELERIANDSLPADNLMFSSTGVALSEAWYKELRAAHLLAERLAGKYYSLWESYRPEGEFEATAASIAEAGELYGKFVASGTGHLVVAMYVRLLRVGLGSADLVRGILAELEDVKTALLDVTYTGGRSNRINGPQSLIQMYNMRPHDAELHDVAGVFAQIGVKAKPRAGPEDVAAALVKLRPDESVVIIYREMRNPIVYRLPDLLPRNIGPSREWIERTRTIVQLPPSKPGRHGGGIVTVGRAGSARIHVLDIVGDGAMRWLSPYGKMASGRPAGPEVFVAAPRAALPSIGSLPTSSRVHGYYQVLEAEIMGHMDDTLVAEAPRIDEVHWRNLRGVIADSTMRDVKGRADPAKVADIAVRHAVQLMQVEMIDVNATVTRRRQYLDEISVSIEAATSQMRDRLATLIEKPVSRAGLLEALERVITSKSNLFKAMEAKNSVLSTTLLHSGEYQT